MISQNATLFQISRYALSSKSRFGINHTQWHQLFQGEASTIINGIDCYQERHRPLKMASLVYERENCVDDIKCRALLDTGAGNSYASTALNERLNKRPTHVEHKRIEMMVCSTIQKVQGYTVKVSSIDGKFEMTTRINKVDKGVLLTVPNPKHDELISKYRHLQGVLMDDTDKKSELPIHVILGASEYSRIKMETKPRIGQSSEPVAELTTLGGQLCPPERKLPPPMFI